MKYSILTSLIVLIAISILCSCNDEEDSVEEIIRTPPEAGIEVNPYQGYFELGTSFTVTSASFDENTSATDLSLNWFTSNKLCEQCELEAYTNLSSFNITFESSQVAEDKRIDLILVVTNEFGLKDTVTHTVIFENETPVIDFKIIPGGEPANENTPFIFDLSNSTDAFGGKDLFLKLDISDNGIWNYERAYENDSSFIITAGGFSRNATTKIKAQLEDSKGNRATAIKSIRLEHGIIIIN